MRHKEGHQEKGFSVRELAGRLGCPFEGDGEVRITGVAGLERAAEGDLVFLSHAKHKAKLDSTKASAAVIPTGESFGRLPVIKSENPHLTFIRAVELFFQPYRPAPGIHPLAFISPSARIGEGVSVGALAAVGDGAEIGDRAIIFPLAAVYPGVKIGAGSIIHSHVSIREGVVIGKNVIIHNGAVIGADGFGYIKAPDGRTVKIPQAGRVIIEDDVEIGANAAVDRAALDETVVRRGAKIDDLVLIAHNVEIGENAILAGQTGIAGSSKIGRDVILGGQVGVIDHVEIGDGVIAAAGSGISKDIPAGMTIAGAPHLDIREWRKVWACLPQLYDFIKEFKRLKARVEELEKRTKSDFPPYAKNK